MLAELTEAMGRIHGRRRRARRAIAGAAVVALIAIAILVVHPLLSTTRLPREYVAGSGDRLIDSPTVVPDIPAGPRLITIVRTDPAVLDRLGANPTSSAVILDDRSLLAALKAIDRPTGLIRFGNEVHLTAAVTDRDLSPPDSAPAPDPAL